MNLSLAEIPLPVRLWPETPMTDDELLRFCADNEVLRIEREPTGELLVMSPAGGESGSRNMDISTDLNIRTRSERHGQSL